MSFFKSWAFWFLVGCFVGVISGYFVAALCFLNKRETRLEKKREQSLMKEKDDSQS